jgi:hypothetical protein
MIAIAASTSTPVDTDSTHCGPKRAASRAATCTPTTRPRELAANSNPYCWASKPYVSWKRNEEDDRYEKRPLKDMPPMIRTPTNTRSLKTPR